MFLPGVTNQINKQGYKDNLICGCWPKINTFYLPTNKKMIILTRTYMSIFSIAVTNKYMNIQRAINCLTMLCFYKF